PVDRQLAAALIDGQMRAVLMNRTAARRNRSAGRQIRRKRATTERQGHRKRQAAQPLWFGLAAASRMFRHRLPDAERFIPYDAIDVIHGFIAFYASAIGLVCPHETPRAVPGRLAQSPSCSLWK